MSVHEMPRQLITFASPGFMNDPIEYPTASDNLTQTWAIASNDQQREGPGHCSIQIAIAMSVSSGTTLISPSNQSTTGIRPQAQTTQRRTSGPSNHHTSHALGHAAHTHGHGHHLKRKNSGQSSNGRRGSETEQGRRALTAGLAMHVIETTGAEGPKGQRRTSTDVCLVSFTSRLRDAHNAHAALIL